MEDEIRPKSIILFEPIFRELPLPHDRVKATRARPATEALELTRGDTAATAAPIDATLRPLHIVWPHRWEFDKNPDEFLSVMVQLHEAGCQFKLSVLVRCVSM